MTSNFMVKHNPAYRDKDYVAFMTPLPSELNGAHAQSTQDIRGPSVSNVARASAAAAKPVPEVLEGIDEDEDEEVVEGSYKGRTFQQAQEQILKELINYQDPERLVQ